MPMNRRSSGFVGAAAGLGALAVVSVADLKWLHVANSATVSITFLMIVLVVAATSRLWAALATSFFAMFAFNFFFLPPVRTLAIWGANAVEQPEHLWTLVAQLRRKIERDPAAPRYLVSEPWVGYRFTTSDASDKLR